MDESSLFIAAEIVPLIRSKTSMKIVDLYSSRKLLVSLFDTDSVYLFQVKRYHPSCGLSGRAAIMPLISNIENKGNVKNIDDKSNIDKNEKNEIKDENSKNDEGNENDDINGNNKNTIDIINDTVNQIINTTLSVLPSLPLSLPISLPLSLPQVEVNDSSTSPISSQSQIDNLKKNGNNDEKNKIDNTKNSPRQPPTSMGTDKMVRTDKDI